MMRKTAISLLMTYCFTLGVFGREVKSFNDNWKFRKGPFLTDQILFQPDIELRWQDVSIPHTWNATDMQNDKNNFYAGEAFYQRAYTPDASLKDKRIFLRFQGVASTAEVYINKVYAGNHKGGYSAFAVEISKLLKFGEENEILIKVDNSSRPDVIPINQTLFGVYGGIYRPVELIVTEKISIAVNDYASPGVYITQKNVNSKSADVNIKVKLENKNRLAEKVDVRTEIYDMAGNLKMTKETTVNLLPQGRQFFEHDYKLSNPHLWQGLDDPYLYKVITQVKHNGRVLDEIVQPLGLRHFELKAEDGMYLNGKKVPMYGVCRHQDWWESGSALTNEQHAKDLEIMKEIGATTIRFAHYQQAEYIYAKCDSMGFIIWAEIPFVNRVSTKEGDNAKQQMVELIRQNYNHPSIYAWGLHNEVYKPVDYTSSLTTELNDLAKSEDPYRYTVSVNGYGDPGHPVNMNADIQGINRYFGWYEKKIQDIKPWIEDMEKDYPQYKIMLAEYGTEANLAHQKEVVGDVGDCCGFNKQYNETFATRFHEVQWGYIAKHPYLLASYLWNTFDFATPASSQGGVEARNMKGLVTFDRKIKKDTFYWYKANWSKDSVLYLTQRRVVDRENKVTPVTVYSNIGIPQLLVNGALYDKPTMGTTAVHYIFENVELKEGDNVVETKLQHNGETYQDKIFWNYSDENKRKRDAGKPVENKNEHIGL